MIEELIIQLVKLIIRLLSNSNDETPPQRRKRAAAMQRAWELQRSEMERLNAQGPPEERLAAMVKGRAGTPSKPPPPPPRHPRPPAVAPRPAPQVQEPAVQAKSNEASAGKRLDPKTVRMRFILSEVLGPPLAFRD